MTKSDGLTIVPIYKGKNKIFDGFAVYQNGKPVKENGKPVVLSLQSDKKHYYLDEKGEAFPKKESLDGIYAKGSLAADNEVYGYSIKYGSRIWKLSFGEYERFSQPALVFTVKNDTGIFKGYTITQFDEKTGKMENRGTVSPENVTYKRRSDGCYACIYNDEQSDRKIIPYYMESISKEVYDQRMNPQRERKTCLKKSEKYNKSDQH
ncbi:MAG: hypothetical protein IJY92_06205 [Alphaproteobacteria bacterium]|nr:hypothetical protein [Alphaproteobacteria bacterium]